jgi:hypothetical protein
VVTFGYSGDNYGAFLKDMWGPPDKAGVSSKLFSGIFINFNRVAFLEIRKDNQRRNCPR